MDGGVFVVTLSPCSLMSGNILECFLVDSAKMRVLSQVFFIVAFKPLSFSDFSSFRTLILYDGIVETVSFWALSFCTWTVLTLLELTCCFWFFFRRQTKLNGSSCCSFSMTSRCIFSISSAFFGSLAANSRVGRDDKLVGWRGSPGGSKSAGTYIVFISSEISCSSFIAGNIGVSIYCRDFRVFAYRFCQRFDLSALILILRRTPSYVPTSHFIELFVGIFCG